MKNINIDKHQAIKVMLELIGKDGSSIPFTVIGNGGSGLLFMDSVNEIKYLNTLDFTGVMDQDEIHSDFGCLNQRYYDICVEFHDKETKHDIQVMLWNVDEILSKTL